MAENIKEEVFIKEELVPSFSLEETSTWDVQKEDVKMENTDNKGRYLSPNVYHLFKL